MNMNQNTNIFAQRLKSVLSASGVERGELARHLGVSVPTVNRWLNGISTPNVYQFRAIAHFFGLPYEWFTEDEGGIPNVYDLAVKLGLSPETVEALLELGELPTALWCASDYMAIGAMNALRLLGLSVPGDVSVMGHDDLYFGLYPNIGLTTLHTPMAELGQAAVQLAMDLIEGSGQAQFRQVFQPSLVVRGSTGPVNGAPSHG